MSLRTFLLLAVLAPMWVCGQDVQRDSIAAGRNNPVNPVILSKKDPVKSSPTGMPNALTMQVIMAQRPASIPEEQWRKMMLDPVNASLYPIRITQAMLDTIDAKQLDMRYQYVMVREIRPK